MNTLKKQLGFACIAALMLAIPVSGFAWGQKGHDVTCTIAQNHLSKKAKKEISRILDGRSIVYYANWMDNASNTDEYRYSKTWHYKNIDADETYETAQENPNGDVVKAIYAQIEALKSGELDPEQEALALKFLVHLVGDLHCPMHMGHRSDSGGNRWQIQYFNNGRNLHGIWDSELIERAHKWSTTEWVEQIDICDKKEAAEIAQGDVDSWGKETYEIACSIYDATPVGSKLSYDYLNTWTPTIEEQLLRAGLRLASILNDIF